MSLLLVYNGRTTDAGEIALKSVRRQEVLDARGNVDHAIHQIVVEGFHKETDEDDLQAWIDTIDAQFVRSATDAEIKHSDNSASGHIIDASLTRNGVGAELEWLDKPGEYATGRTYRAVLTGEYEASVGYVSFNESIQIIGTGGERNAYLEPIEGLPLKQRVNKNTIVTAIQQGSAIHQSDFQTYPTPLWPEYEDVPKRRLGKSGPVVLNGSTRDYGTQWSYEFTASSAVFGGQDPNSE